MRELSFSEIDAVSGGGLLGQLVQGLTGLLFGNSIDADSTAEQLSLIGMTAGVLTLNPYVFGASALLYSSDLGELSEVGLSEIPAGTVTIGQPVILP